MDPDDFSVEMGHPGDYDHADVTGPMQEILALCRKYDVPFGTTASSAETAQRLVAQGIIFFEAVDELTLIFEESARRIQDIQGDNSPIPDGKR